MPHPRNAIAATLTFFLLGVASAAARSAGDAEANALTLLLPHEKGRALCYASKVDPVTYLLEDFPTRKTPRTITIGRFLFELKSEKHDDDDTVTPPAPGEFYYSYRMVAEVEGKKARLISAGECGSERCSAAAPIATAAPWPSNRSAIRALFRCVSPIYRDVSA